MHDMNEIVGTHDIVFITLDTLRYDVASRCLREGRIPKLAQWLLPLGWEERHSPGSFTFAAHQAFFAGFLPTPARPGRHPRLFAVDFPGSETTGPETCVFDAPNIVAGLAERGYCTICVGGVGFFNPHSQLGRVLPALFAERYWQPEFGVTDPASTRHQVNFICERLKAIPSQQRVFLFLNVSALHQPNYFYLSGAHCDTIETHAAALAYVDEQLPPIWKAFRQRGPAFCIICSDHGTAYGEDGYVGHRLAHPVVWTVPYADFLLPKD